jgi:hypothetical protein
MTARTSIARLADCAPDELSDVPATPTEMAAVLFVKEMAAHVDEKRGRPPTREVQNVSIHNHERRECLSQGGRMTPIPEHSPLPWRIHIGRGGYPLFIDANGEEISPTWVHHARLIVRAVNSHDRLLAAAKFVIAQADESCQLLPDGHPYRTPQCNEVELCINWRDPTLREVALENLEAAVTAAAEEPQ